MGCSTDFSGEGIVGNHAYSILDVQEIWGITPGEQLSIKNFFSLSHSTSEGNGDEDVCCVEGGDDMKRASQQQASTSAPDSSAAASSAERECIDEIQSTGRLRMICIRNPWGQVGWKGSFSSRSSLWTNRLREALRVPNQQANDGTFWMTYHDFLRRYATIDVCKAFPSADWRVHCLRDTLGGVARGGLVTDSSFTITVQSLSSSQSTISGHVAGRACGSQVFLSLLQDSKRGGTAAWSKGDLNLTRSYWYADLSFILRRKPSCAASPSANIGTTDEVICACFTSPMRNSLPIELTLEDGQYTLTVFRFAPLTETSRLQHYYVHLYSPDAVSIAKTASHPSPSSQFSSTGGMEQKRLKLHHTSHFPAEMNLISYLVDRCLHHVGSSNIRCEDMHYCSVATHRLLCTQITPTIAVEVFVVCGNGVNILYCRYVDAESTDVVPSLAVCRGDNGSVIDLTCDDDDDNDDRKKASLKSRDGEPENVIQSQVSVEPYVYVGVNEGTLVMVLTCVLESEVRVISPFKMPQDEEAARKKGGSHGILRLASSVPSCRGTRVLAVMIDGQQSDGFELDKKVYIQHVFVSSTLFVACCKDLNMAQFDISRIEQFIHDEKNILYPNYFRIFTTHAVKI
jgi:hypothetical protein